MSQFELKSSESVALTKKLAEKHRNMAASPTERGLNQRRLEYLKDRIDNGYFIPPSWAIAEIDGVSYRMNGQHSSTALCEANGEFPAGLKAHIDTYTLKDMDQAVLLFRQFDSRLSSRSGEDVIGAYMGIRDDLVKIKPKIGKLAVEGENFHRRIRGEPCKSGDDVGMLCEFPDVRDFVKWFSALPIIVKSKELHGKPVVGAMAGTVRQSPALSTDFWSDTMKRNHQFDDTHPATVLENYLSALKSKEDKPKRMPTPAAIYEACVLSWNAWRAESPISLKLLFRVDAKKGVSEISE